MYWISYFLFTYILLIVTGLLLRWSFNFLETVQKKHVEYVKYVKILPSRVLSNDYIWEKLLNRNQFYVSGITGIDFIHLYKLVDQKD